MKEFEEFMGGDSTCPPLFNPLRIAMMMYYLFWEYRTVPHPHWGLVAQGGRKEKNNLNKTEQAFCA
jgi:hypothetical protein